MNLTKSTDFTPNLGRLTSALPPLFLRCKSANVKESERR